mgnify:CR=1 FL=1
MTTRTSVAVIGAGVAGLAASKELRAMGVDHVVLEAKPEVGGRAICDDAVFGFPYDLGAFWLGDDGDNLLIDVATELGFDVSDTSFPGPDVPMILGNNWETPAQKTERLAYVHAAMEAIHSYDASLPDRSIAEVAGTKSPWFPVFASWMGMLKGLPIEKISVIDQATRHHRHSVHQVRGGMGTLIKAWAEPSEILLETPVKALNWSPTGIELDANGETVTADAAILTASVGVLGSDTIRYGRPLPDDVRNSLDRMAMGNVNRIAVKFDGDVFGEGCPPMFGRYVTPDRYIYVMSRLVGQNVALGYVGNDLADALEHEPDDVAVALLTEALAIAIGLDVRERIIAVHCTRWRSDPWTLGAYASVVPGAGNMREALRKPWDGRVFVAGDASSPRHFNLVHGAAQEGIRAARATASLTGT